MKSDDLRAKRDEIDNLDTEIVRLLHRRGSVAMEIGALKDASARGVYAPERERQVIEQVKKLASMGPLSGDHLAAIYRQVISACRALERPPRVAYFGPAATFTHQAALERFGEATELIPMATIPDVFTETQRGEVDFGVVPVENSTEGPVHPTLDAFVESDLKVISEIVLPISMQLMSLATDRDAIKRVYSIPIAYAQCREWIERNLPGRETVDAVSTARAAMLAVEDPSGAAIGPSLAAAVYGLNIVAQDIQDLASNFTRFYVIASQGGSAPSGRDKTAMVFSLHDRVGALHDVTGVFARRGINLSSILSRPSRRRAWDYVFFAEFGGHEQDPTVGDALAELAQHTGFVKVMGSWPAE